MPGLQTLLSYDAAWLRNDVTAGIVLSTMLVPVGIAYAVASGVPAIYGLYATIVPLIVYALFGPSRVLEVAAQETPQAPAEPEASTEGVLLRPASCSEPAAAGPARHQNGVRSSRFLGVRGFSLPAGEQRRG